MNYYDLNAKEFFSDTVNADMSTHHEEFLKNLPENACILDAGCGSGRDAKFFMSKGFKVLAMDGSAEMCKIASKHIGKEVLHMQFQEITFKNYSGKDNYASFKYGDFEGMRNGRYFNDLDEKTSNELFSKLDFKILKIWITHDSRKNRENEKWVNILVKK